jgi:hypothetical protein
MRSTAILTALVVAGLQTGGFGGMGGGSGSGSSSAEASVDSVPSSPNALDDEFSDGATTGWTWVNQGTATVVEEYGNQTIRDTGDGAWDARLRVKDISSLGASYTVAVMLSVNALNQNYHVAGVVLRNSTAGRTLLCGPFISAAANQMLLTRYTNAGLSADVSTSGTALTNRGAYRFSVAGGDASCQFSVDGRSWGTLATESLATYLTAAGGSVDQAGFALNVYEARASALVVDWFRVNY